MEGWKDGVEMHFQNKIYALGSSILVSKMKCLRTGKTREIVRKLLD